MCVTSYVGDWWTKTLPDRYGDISTTTWPEYATKEDLAALRKDIEALRVLLVAAKAYDEATGQPDCEVEEKVHLIKRLAELVGVDLEDVFGKHTNIP